MDIRIGTVLEGPDGQTITIESVLGRGGFGQVFAGRLPDSTLVAVKTVLTASLTESELHTLQNEAKHTVGLIHPNVMRVLYVNDGIATAGSPPYMVMEYVGGGTLRDVIDRHKAAKTPIPINELRAIYLQIGRGMDAVSARLVHRDLKPENVLVDGGDHTLKIADFGLAKLADAATRSETFKGWGTRPYQAPEAFDGGQNTPAMDVYAAGVMFYELATLVWPVQPAPSDNGPLAWRNAHLLTPPKDIRDLRRDLPLDLVQLITSMLQKNPTKRPAPWSVVLARLTAGQPAEGTPDVTALVMKATSTLVKNTESEARQRAEREKAQERKSLLEQAFTEPVEILRGLVQAFNAASTIGTLEMKVVGPLSVEIRSKSGSRQLSMIGEMMGDLDMRSDGLARLAVVVKLQPMPTPESREQVWDQNTVGGFNLVYRVRGTSDRFGDWQQFIFELSPLIGRDQFPHWQHIELHALPRQLQILHAMGEYQHKQQALDDAWFKELLVQIL